METNALSNVFLQSQEKLKDSLQGLKLPKDYAELQRIVNSHIETLLIEDNEFSNSLNASDAEMLNYALRMALSFQKLSLTDSIDFKTLSVRTEYEVESTLENDSNTSVIENTLSLLPTVICAFINPWLAMVAGLGTIGYKKVYCKNRKQTVNIKEFKRDISRLITKEEIQTVVTGIESLCKEIDSIMAKIQRDRKDLTEQLNRKLDNCVFEKMYPEILTSLQYLFMENFQTGTKNQYVQNMLFSLQGYGYEVVALSEPNSGFFIKKINPNVTKETMYLPAIVKEVEGVKIIVAQGIVYIPPKN